MQDGIVYLKEDAKTIWYSDLSPEEQDAAWNDLWKAQSHTSFTHMPSFITSDIKVHKTYVFCEFDKVVDPAYQEAITQFGQYDEVVRLPSGHAPMLSMPEKLVDIIVGAAAK